MSMTTSGDKGMDEAIAITMAAWNTAIGLGHEIDVTYAFDMDVACDTKEHCELIQQLSGGKVEPQVLCPHCRKLPCLLDVHYERMVELGKEIEDDPENFGNHSNNTCRFHIYSNMIREIYGPLHIYSNMIREIYGPLGKGVRRRLPECIVNEVHDMYPAHKGTTYTGFKGVGKEIVD